MEKLLQKIININLSVIEGDNSLMFEAIKKDKKQVDDGIIAVLMRQDMSLEIVHNVTRDEINIAISKMKEILG